MSALSTNTPMPSAPMPSAPTPSAPTPNAQSFNAQVTPLRAGSIGLGWRPETALFVEQHAQLQFTEVVAENICHIAPLAAPLAQLLDRGTVIIPHGISLSLGSAEPLRTDKLDHLAALVEKLRAPFVSEHIAMVRGGGTEAEHLLPIAHTQEMVDIIAENVALAKRWLPVPLVLENIATLFSWPQNEMTEPEFLTAVLRRTDAKWLFDVSNFYANCINQGERFEVLLDQMPLERIAYVHVAGGKKKGSLYHDTHAHPIGSGALDALTAVCKRLPEPPPVLLERDAGFGRPDELAAELSAIAQAASPEHCTLRSDDCPLAMARAVIGDNGSETTRPATATSGARARQASAQAELVRALVHNEPAPANFDRSRLLEAGRALHEKRARVQSRGAPSSHSNPSSRPSGLRKRFARWWTVGG